MSVNFMHFENKENYISHEEAAFLFNSTFMRVGYEQEDALHNDQAKKLLVLAKLVSRCLHEDWKQNLINERGTEYQHFRPVKDSALTEMVLANPEGYLSLRSEDDKPLFKLVPKQRKIKKEIEEDGVKKLVETDEYETYTEVQFDLIRVDFDNLTDAWQNANLDAAKFAIALIHKALPQGALQGDPQKVFEDLEKMSHDVHIEWMIREQDWGDISLFFPYELLTSEEQSKDTAQLLSIIEGLSFKSNIFARNRAIVIRAIKETLGQFATDAGLEQTIMKNLEAIEPIIAKYTEENEKRSSDFKLAVAEQTVSALQGKDSLTFEDFEKLAEIYYNEWKRQASQVMTLPKAYESSYENHVVSHPRINFKAVARKEMVDLVTELVQGGFVSSSILDSIQQINNPASDIAKKIIAKNDEDFANYQASLKGNVKPE